MLIAPGDAAVTNLEVGDGLGFCGEGRFERIDAVADCGLGLGIATVGGLDPIDGGGLIGAPTECAGAGLDSIAVDGQVVDQRSVVKDFGIAGCDGEDFAALGKTLVRLVIGERPVQLFGEDVLAVGRSLEAGEDTGLAELADGASEFNFCELGSCVVLEDVLVVGGLEQVFVGGRGGGFAVVLLHHGTGWDF